MRTGFLLTLSVSASVFFATASSGNLFAADAGAAANPAATDPRPSKFTDAQREHIHSWIRQIVPECPRESAALAVEAFLEELQLRSPGEYSNLLSPGFPFQNYRSMLLRTVGVQLTASGQAALREEVARRRVQELLAGQAEGKVVGDAEAAELVGKIKGMAPVFSRRLFEGRMEDDDVLALLKKARDPGAASAVAAPPKPRVLSSGDIVSEFTRRNQEGAAWQQLRAITMQSRLKTAAGEELEIFLFRMRPNRFRMAVRVDDVTRLITAYDGARYWQQTGGQAAETIPAKSIGERRFLGEFTDPLFASEGVAFERLEDGIADGSKIFRIAVRREDGSRHVAWIDQETFRQVGREMTDKLIVRYSDFRTVGGITLAFCEESTDSEGRKTLLTIERATPNAGLIQEFFEAPPPGNLGYFELERMVGRASLSAAPRLR